MAKWLPEINNGLQNLFCSLWGSYRKNSLRTVDSVWHCPQSISAAEKVPRNLEENRFVILRMPLSKEVCDSAMQVLASCAGHSVVSLCANKLVSELQLSAYLAQIALVAQS